VSPWLRLTLRGVRLLLIFMAASAVCAAVTAGTALAHAAAPGAGRPGTARGPDHPDPGRPIQADPGRPVHADPGRPVHADPGHPVHADPGRPVRPGDEHSARPDHWQPQQGFTAPWVLPVPSDSASASASARPSGLHPSALRPSRPAEEPSRAGSRAGEGRMRPGRPDGVEGDDDTGPGEAPDSDAAQPEEPQTADAPDTLPPPEEAGLDPASPTPPTTVRQPVQQGGAPAEPVLQILPLGSGLMLIGLGLGLAFLGLRLRRS
jgi:hypothetical protein